ncbi:SDR family NAD(P)-dependent oxidoreductase [Muricoccus aerilatus]|uniref:SDR family NAD(P)-dependent oxidoreductase n=1 Tax=Muricoccus aerilatus TaxID=452982 RepID=UPI0005C18384|nr:SDR family NAD(P)-dependent oxidoreductase [Roseomonas aerilata]
MDLGIAGRHAIVCAASKGLGRACAVSLARAGVSLTIAARTKADVEAVAGEIGTAHGVAVTAVTADVTTPEGRTAILAAAPRADILVNNAGGPPRGDFRSFSPDQWMAAVNDNMVAAIEMIRALVDGMIEQRFGRIVNITSGAVRSPVADLSLSTAARLGLTGYTAGVARQVARHNVTINNLLPGRFETDRFRSGVAGRAKSAGISYEEQFERQRSVVPAQRFGDPAEFGDACAYLCSRQASFIVGQNLLLDGGEFPGTF